MTTALESLTPAQLKALPMAVDLYGRTEPTLTRLKAAASAAVSATRRHVAQPWNPPPAYAASTGYRIGQRAVNSGNIYLATTAGTTGSASAPTATSLAPITDGSVVWQYMGPTYAADPSAPTYSTSATAPTGLQKFYRSANCTFNSGAAEVISNKSWYERSGATGGLTTSGIGDGATGPNQAIFFATDSQTIVIAQISAPANDAAPMIEVDGRYLVDGMIPHAAAQNATTYFTITFPTKKDRIVVFRNYSQQYFTAVQGVYCERTASVWPGGKLPGDLYGMAVGDSLFEANSFGAEFPDRGIAGPLFSELGITKYYVDTVGGTGFVSGGTGNSFNAAARTAAIAAVNPEVLFVEFSANDTSQTQAAIDTAIRSWVSTVRGIIGADKWIIFSGLLNRGASELAAEGYARQTLTSLADPRILFVPITGAPSPYLTGTGTTTSPTGVGNGDIYMGDTLHPSPRGRVYVGRRLGIDIRNRFLAM